MPPTSVNGGGLVTGPTNPTTSLPKRGNLTPWRWAALVVFVVGVGARLAPVLLGAGLGSNLAYDPGVYFAAADGLVHGRLPYRDFVLLHPPGIMLALSPFAVTTRFLSDHAAFIAANLAFTVLGAFNAVLIVVIGRKLGLSLTACAGGGLFAALWLGSVHAEDMARLEPLGNLFVLIALYAYARARGHPSGRWLFVMGAGLGAATSVKIWYVVPLLVLLAWVVVRVRERRAVIAATSGAAAAMVAINGVFFCGAPDAMWHMVVLDQLGRVRFAASPLTRFAQANALSSWNRFLGPGPTVFAAAVLVIGTTLLLRAAWTRPAGRLPVVLVGVQMVVLALSPSWFAFYADYLTPALALALAVGVDGLRDKRSPATGPVRPATWVAKVAVVGAFTVLIAPLTWQRAGAAFPGTRLARAVGATRCVTADEPMALIELNALSRSFSPGCQDWVDVVGRTYGADRMNTTRRDNPAWQRDIKAYLLSGDAFIVVRAGTGLSRSTRATLARCPVLARADGYVIYVGRSTTHGRSPGG